MTEERTGGDKVIDWTAALEGVGGDDDLLKVLIETFIEEVPKLLTAIHLCLEQRDSVSFACSEETRRYLGTIASKGDTPAGLLHRATHTIKGNLRIFGSTPATQPVEELEEFLKQLEASLKPIDTQVKDLPDTVKKAEKERLIEASGILSSPAYLDMFGDVPRRLAEVEPLLERVLAVMKKRIGG